MDKDYLCVKNIAPVVIGGVGGSGTRFVAQCLQDLDFYMGGDLNKANDNLWFTFLFKRIEVLSSSDEDFSRLLDIFLKAMLSTAPSNFTEQQIQLIMSLVPEGSHHNDLKWFRDRAHTLIFNNQQPGLIKKWGWKEPNSHIVLDRLIKKIPGMRYIHVVRNGLDMAFSLNKRQINLWGEYFLGKPFDASPCYCLKYWRRIHERVITIGDSMGENFLILNYDKLCTDPGKELRRLLNFLFLDYDLHAYDLMKSFKKPDSIGRFRQYGTGIFAASDIEFVRSLGFDIE